MKNENSKRNWRDWLVDLRRKTTEKISESWEKIYSQTRRAVTGGVDPDLGSGDEEYIKEQIGACVFGTEGEVSSRARAVELGKIYQRLAEAGRRKFMEILAREFDVDNEEVDQIMERIHHAEDEDSRVKLEMALSKALIPPRLRLLKQFNALPDGFKFLIDFRAELLPILKDDPYFKKLETDLRDLLSSWFDVGLLDLTEITWQSPASLLEKLIEYEAVHEIRSWADLKNRLDSDRHCFAFFHNKMPDEPLIFVEVALVSEMSDSIQQLLDEEEITISPEEADTAIFYSISSAQKGLAGINLGNFLIKRVVQELSKQLKGLKHYATLSPVPNFRKWLDPLLIKGDESVLTLGEVKTLKTGADDGNAAHILRRYLDSDWPDDRQLSDTLKPILMRLCAKYLLEEKRDSKAADPVANFHLSNGALINRLNWLADRSEKGLKQSASIMVNYYYKLSDIEKNHELYTMEGKIDASRDVRKWLKS